MHPRVQNGNHQLGAFCACCRASCSPCFALDVCLSLNEFRYIHRHAGKPENRAVAMRWRCGEHAVNMRWTCGETTHPVPSAHVAELPAAHNLPLICIELVLLMFMQGACREARKQGCSHAVAMRWTCGGHAMNMRWTCGETTHPVPSANVAELPEAHKFYFDMY